MRKIAIVEDETTSAQLLKDNLHRYLSEKGVEFEVDFFQSAEEFLHNYQPKHEIVFFDINLSGMDGMSAARELRKVDKKIMVVFLTTLAHYAVYGYEVGAFDFIVKPLTWEVFKLKMDRIYGYFARSKSVNINVSYRGKLDIINSSKIKYVEVNKHAITYHTTMGNFPAHGSMKDVIKELEGLNFVLCNQCYLVNLKYVNGVKKNICKIGEEELIISTPRHKEFMKSLTHYLARGRSQK